MLRRCAVVLPFVLCAMPGAARADLLPLIYGVEPSLAYPVTLGVIGTGLLSGPETGGPLSPVVGGGLAASFHFLGPYAFANASQRLWHAVDVRARIVDDLSFAGGHVTLPVDVLVRTVVILDYRGGYHAGRVEERPFELQPYVAVGGTVAFPISPIDVRAGPIATLGVAWYLDDRISLLLELEGRLMLGGEGPVGQFGLNLGILVGA
jgi:hypothetical protein